MNGFSLVRFFAVVLRPHITLAATATLLLGMAAWMARNDPQEIGELSTLALFVQMFAAASGFREPARRGHFDPVLARGTSRLVVAGAHWAVSITPGAITWVALAAVILWIHPGEVPVGLTLQGLVAILYVSTASWAAGLWFTRYASGVIWMLALVLLSGMNAVPTLRAAFFVAPRSVGDSFRQAGAGLVCPTFLVASGRSADDGALILILLVTAVLLAVGGLCLLTLDVPLQDPS
jgi:hypothetical protein